MTEQQQPPEFKPAVTGEVLDAITTPPTATKRSIKLPIILMVWPAVSVIGGIALYAIINFILSSSPDSSNLNIFRTIVNVLLFLVGAIGIIAGPISFIVGLILLIVNLQKK